MRPLKLVPDNTNIGFLRWRWVALAISVVLLFGSIGIVATKGLNWGVDFVGGQQMRITFVQPVAIGELRNRIEALDVGEVSIQQLGDGKSVNMRIPLEGAANPIAKCIRSDPGSPTTSTWRSSRSMSNTREPPIRSDSASEYASTRPAHSGSVRASATKSA
jgi:preprotein translocase subunit SecF